VSKVALPADETVGIGRAQLDQNPADTITTSEVTALTEEQRAAAEAATLAANAVRAADLQRLDDIQGLGKRFKMEALADRCALEGKTVDETRTVLLAEMQKNQADTVTTETRTDVSTKKEKEHPVITIHQTVTSF